MNFQQIQFSIAVDDTKSFTKAAALCCVTQPTLSNAVAQLEEELGERLFERTTRSVRTTKFGEHVLRDMRSIASSRADIIRYASDNADKESKTFILGVSPLVDAEFLEQLIKRTRTAIPKTEIILQEMNAGDIASELSADRIDLAIGPVSFGDQNTLEKHIYEEPLLMISNNHDADQPNIMMSALGDHQFVLVENNCGLTRTTRTLFAEHSVTLDEYAGRAMSYAMLENWAKLGIGAALLPASKVSKTELARPVIDHTGNPVAIGFEAVWAARENPRSGLSDILNLLN